jgi:phage tail tape-measure protein
MTIEQSRRVYRPKRERTPSGAKAAIAAARSRDARGHFLPVVGDRGRLGGVVRPAARKGRREPEAGDSVALNVAEAV